MSTVRSWFVRTLCRESGQGHKLLNISHRLPSQYSLIVVSLLMLYLLHILPLVLCFICCNGADRHSTVLSGRGCVRDRAFWFAKPYAAGAQLQPCNDQLSHTVSEKALQFNGRSCAMRRWLYLSHTVYETLEHWRRRIISFQSRIILGMSKCGILAKSSAWAASWLSWKQSFKNVANNDGDTFATF